jgi:hypothetical protein
MGLGRNARFCWLAVCFSGWSVPSRAEEPAVHIVIYDPQHQVPGGLDSARRALVEEFRRLGIELDCSRGDETFSRAGITIPVVVRSHLASDWGLPPDALGTVRGGERRMIYLFFPAIENALPEIPSGKGTILRRHGAFARPWSVGVARVIAHEILHFLLPGRSHDRTGLFAGHFTEDMLLGSTLALAPTTTSTLLSRLRVVELVEGCGTCESRVQ